MQEPNICPSTLQVVTALISEMTFHCKENCNKKCATTHVIAVDIKESIAVQLMLFNNKNRLSPKYY